jgi:ABC-type glutathione transport system ATPase component
MSELLTTRELRVSYRVGREEIAALRGVSLDILAGQAVGLLGESGSGKSTLGATLLAFVPVTARASGIINFAGSSLLTASEREVRKIRGARISYIAQDPAQSLSPVLRVGEQIADVLRAHQNINRRQCRENVEAALKEVALDAALYDAYPHQLSGGQRQRVAIAQALICRPSLLIADEPTTALDPTTQAEILDLIKRLRAQHGMAMLLISHDPAVLSEMVDYVYVLQYGEVVEHGPAEMVLNAPSSPYTRSLLDATPRLAFDHAG